MLFFEKKKKKLQKKDREFYRQLAELNALIDNLDFKIAEFRRKFQSLQMHGRRWQSVSELEQMLTEMRLQAKQAQDMMQSLRQKHMDYIGVVERMVEEFDKAIAGLPEE